MWPPMQFRRFWAVNIDRFIDAVTATATPSAAELEEDEEDRHLLRRMERLVRRALTPDRRGRDQWEVAPRRIEDEYNVTDAVVVGNLLISLLRHSDRVGVACIAQLANVIAPIMTERGGPAWRQPTFHPFAITSRLAAGQVLRLETDSPTVSTTKYGDITAVDAVATYDDGKLAVFLVNRGPDRGHRRRQPHRA